MSHYQKRKETQILDASRKRLRRQGHTNIFLHVRCKWTTRAAIFDVTQSHNILVRFYFLLFNLFIGHAGCVCNLNQRFSGTWMSRTPVAVKRLPAHKRRSLAIRNRQMLWREAQPWHHLRRSHVFLYNDGGSVTPPDWHWANWTGRMSLVNAT